MRHSTKRLLGLPFILIAVIGSVHAQTEPRDERPAGRANSLVTKAAGLVPQSGEGSDIRSAFNENVDRVRLMVLLSPT